MSGVVTIYADVYKDGRYKSLDMNRIADGLGVEGLRVQVLQRITSVDRLTEPVDNPAEHAVADINGRRGLPGAP
jgi:hypothetical protein